MKKYIIRRLGQGGINTLLRCGYSTRPIYSENDFVTAQLALLCIINGSGVYNDQTGRKTSFRTGDVVVRYPNCHHSLDFTSVSEVAYIAVPAEVLKIIEQLSPGILRSNVFHTFLPTSLIKHKHYEIYLCLKSVPDHELFKAAVLMQDFIAMLCKDNSADKFQKACELLESNITSKMSMPDIAKQLNLSYSYFRKEFTSKMGISPAKYLINKRLERAYELLQEGTSINQVAEKLNYSDVYTFSRQFKKFLGISPSQVKNLL